MTSACIFRVTLKTKTQMFLSLNSPFSTCLRIVIFHSNHYLLEFINSITYHGNIEGFLVWWSSLSLARTSSVTFLNESIDLSGCFAIFISSKKLHINSSNSTHSDILCVEQLSREQNPERNNIRENINSTEFCSANTRETITISNMAFWAPHKLTIYSDSSESTIPFGHER